MIDPIINAESSHVTKDDSKSCPCHFIYYLHLYTRFDLTEVCVCVGVYVCVCVCVCMCACVVTAKRRLVHENTPFN